MSSLGPCAVFFFYSPFIHGLIRSCSWTHNFVPAHLQVCSIPAAFISHASLFLQLFSACNTFPWAKLGENETSFSDRPRHIRMLQIKSVLLPAIWERSLGPGRLLSPNHATLWRGVEKGWIKTWHFEYDFVLIGPLFSALTTAVFLGTLVGFALLCF